MTHNTREVEEIPKFYAGGSALAKGEVVVTYKDHLHQLQKARQHELEVLAVHLDRQLAGYTSVSLDSIYRYIEDRQKAIQAELDQDKK